MNIINTSFKSSAVNSKYFPYIIIALCCWVTYSNALKHSFLLDDYGFLFYPGNVHDFNGFVGFFTKTFQGFYRPVGCILLKVLHLTFQNNLIGYQLVNLGFFTAICILFFEIILWASRDRGLALLSSLLYTVHPINNILVNFKSMSIILFSILAMQVSLRMFLKYFDDKNKTCLAVSLVFYPLSFLSHELGILLPGYIALILYFISRSSVKNIIEKISPYILIAVMYWFLRSRIPGLRPIEGLWRLDIGVTSYLASAVSLVHWYISKLFILTGVVIVWDIFPLKEDLLFWNIVFWGFTAAVIYLIFVRWRTGIRPLALSVFVLGLLPVGIASFANTFWFKTVYIEPHWFGFSSIGFFILFAYGLLSLQSYCPRVVWQSVMVILLASLAGYTYHNNPVWKDEDAYCSYWLKISPANVTAKRGKASAYIRQHDKGVDPRAYSDREEVSVLIKSFEILGEDQKAEKYRRILSNMQP